MPRLLEGFLKLLPDKQDGLPLRHVVEVRNPTFQSPDFVSLLEKYGVAVVLAEHADYPMIADVTADFVYLRLQKGSDDIKTCYAADKLDLWAERAKAFHVIDSCRVLSIATNLGDTKTIISHPATTSHGRLSEEQRQAAGITQGTIRVAVGLEHHEDIQDDLLRGLRGLAH